MDEWIPHILSFTPSSSFPLKTARPTCLTAPYFRLVPVLVRSMKYSEIDIILLKGDVEEVTF